MPELRYNPLLDTWTMVADNRQNRPNLDPSYCPFCPSSGKVPAEYTVLSYPNDFPALSTSPPAPRHFAPSQIYRTAESYGSCEVILFSSSHDASLWELPLEHIVSLLELIGQRCRALAADARIKYLFPFENRGEAVGVTMLHPHGQLYAYPFVPLKIETELRNARKHYETTGVNLFEQMISEERADGWRIIAENAHFIAFIPFFTDYPFGVFIVARRPRVWAWEFEGDEQRDLAAILKLVTTAFDALYHERYPNMMCWHQAPVNREPNHDDQSTDEAYRDYYRFHIQFYPPFRAKGVIKHNASSETGAWAAANTRAVEDTAAELRAAIGQG